jgi:hypothetical protein
MPSLDVLIPTYDRPAALAVTLAGQTLPDFRVIVSDRSDVPVETAGEVRALLAVLRAQGRPVELPRHLPRRGEDVLAQLRVMARFGGCAVLPSGVHHLELPTTIPDREVDAPRVLETWPACE